MDSDTDAYVLMNEGVFCQHGVKYPFLRIGNRQSMSTVWRTTSNAGNAMPSISRTGTPSLLISFSN
ncbi:MAG: hypothetical protein HN919_05175 [Verrucomicrobia bacterium]|nr:hypothetical protein [Verrucomicrobiota bacterium]MBT7065672.1 hypothetical protein [Verrucomicrobiota bacterium]